MTECLCGEHERETGVFIWLDAFDRIHPESNALLCCSHVSSLELAVLLSEQSESDNRCRLRSQYSGAK